MMCDAAAAAATAAAASACCATALSVMITVRTRRKRGARAWCVLVDYSWQLARGVGISARVEQQRA